MEKLTTELGSALDRMEELEKMVSIFADRALGPWDEVCDPDVRAPCGVGDVNIALYQVESIHSRITDIRNVLGRLNSL